MRDEQSYMCEKRVSTGPGSEVMKLFMLISADHDILMVIVIYLINVYYTTRCVVIADSPC